MADEQTPSRYPYLISVRGGRPVPARKDGSYNVCAYQTFLGLWWSPREVTVLDYDPHRDNRTPPPVRRGRRDPRTAATRPAEPAQTGLAQHRHRRDHRPLIGPATRWHGQQPSGNQVGDALR